MAAVPPGSYLAFAHPASDVATEQMTRSMGEYNRQAAAPVTARSHAEVCRFFAGLDLVEPGVMPLPRWRPDSEDEARAPTMAWAGVGRKP